MIKKLIYILFAVPLMMLSACSDDDDMAQVDLTFQLSGVTLVDDTFYTISGETVSVDGVVAKSLTSDPATIQRVQYTLDGFRLPIELDNPFGTEFSTTDFGLGTHRLGMSGVVLQEDKTITEVAVQMPLKIVESIEDLPEGAPQIGTYTKTISMQH